MHVCVAGQRRGLEGVRHRSGHREPWLFRLSVAADFFFFPVAVGIQYYISFRYNVVIR